MRGMSEWVPDYDVFQGLRESFREANALADRIIARCAVIDFLRSEGISVRENDPR